MQIKPSPHCYLAIFLLSGCATIVSKDNYPVNIKSDPSGINFSIKNKKGEIVKRGKTPTIVNLNSGAGFFRVSY